MLKQYIPFLGILALIVLGSLAVLQQSIVGPGFTSISFVTFATHPLKYLTEARKRSPEFSFTPVDQLANTEKITVDCQPKCVISLDNLRSVDAVAADNNPDEVATEVGVVIWDEIRQLVLYEVYPSDANKERHKFVVRDYNQDWSFGNLHWIEGRVPAGRLRLVGYDQTNGYILVEHIDNSGTVFRTSQFSVTDPILFTQAQ